MFCQKCGEYKLKSEMNRKGRYYRVCWKKVISARYRKKNKTQIRKYFKKWYQEKGRAKRGLKRRKDFSARNKKIYHLGLLILSS